MQPESMSQLTACINELMGEIETIESDLRKGNYKLPMAWKILLTIIYYMFLLRKV